MKPLPMLLAALAVASALEHRAGRVEPVSARLPLSRPSFAVGRPVLLASKRDEQARAQDLAAAGWVAGLALASEVVQYVNTAAVIWAFQRTTGARSLLGLVDALTAVFGQLGWKAYPAYALLLISISVLPLMSALMFIFVAGMLFGPLVGTVIVSLSLSSASVIAWAIARRVSEQRDFTIETLSPRAGKIDRAIGSRPMRTQLFLITLLRLSPVLPFTFSNYLAGLTSISPVVLFAGTLLGTLPTQTVYVSAGSLGRKALEGGLNVPLPVIIGGVFATIAAVVMVGHISTQVSQQTIDEMEDSAPKKRFAARRSP